MKHLCWIVVSIAASGCNLASFESKKEKKAETTTEEYTFEQTADSLVKRLVGENDKKEQKSQSLSIASKLKQISSDDVVKKSIPPGSESNDIETMEKSNEIIEESSEATISSDERQSSGEPVEVKEIDERAEIAIRELATKLEIAEDKIKVIVYQGVEWGSSALGCSQPDHAYNDVIVKGVRLILGTEENTYFYHGDDKEPLFLCEKPDFDTPTDPDFCKAWFSEDEATDCVLPSYPDICSGEAGGGAGESTPPGHGESVDGESIAGEYSGNDDLQLRKKELCSSEIVDDMEKGKEPTEILREVILELLKLFDDDNNGTLSKEERDHAVAVILKALLNI